MKHSELRHQPRHVNPRIQVVVAALHLWKRQMLYPSPSAPYAPYYRSGLFSVSDVL